MPSDATPVSSPEGLRFDDPAPWLAVGALVAIWLVTSEPRLMLLALPGVANAFSHAPDEPDTGALGMYVGLALVLALLSRITVPVTAS